jgi:hypothetical protein
MAKEVAKKIVSVPLVYSTRFTNCLMDILATMKYSRNSNSEVEIVRTLYKAQNKASDVSFIDLSEKMDTVTFIPSDKIFKLFFLDFKKLDKDNMKLFVKSEKSLSIIHRYFNDYEGVWNKYRTEIKIGKFIKKLCPKICDADIEIFVNKFKARYKSKNSKPDFVLIKGKTINEWYSKSKYEHYNSSKDEGVGTLGKSCMRYGHKYFNVYTQNDEVCNLLILRSENGKLLGRALVWKLQNDMTYMDRIYTHFDSDVHLFLEYAANNKWLTHHDSKTSKMKLTIKVKNFSYNKFPYMDTFKYYNSTKGYISNQLSTKDKNNDDRIYICQNTRGAMDRC